MVDLNTSFLNEIFDHYNFNNDQYVGYKVISKGHINTTYVLYFDYGNKVKRFLLQEINTEVFKEPEKLMKNISKVTSFSLKKLKNKSKKYKNKTLRIYKSKNKETYVRLKDNSCWRVYHYIENSISIDKTIDNTIMYESGKVIGDFYNIYNNFDSKKIYEVIKDFHNTPKRFQTFVESTINNPLCLSCKNEIDFLISNQKISSLIQDLIDSDKMPIRVSHNDTKLNNIMFEYKTNKGICLVDLDTIMPGCICFDYGDFVRSACNSSFEDEKDLEKVNFLFEQFISFSKGFIEKTNKFISDIEIDNLVNGAIVMTYECGMRFLTDYLNNNVYFKISYIDQNLVRAKTQIHLCKQIIANKEKLEKIINDIYIKTKAS